jgi:hypothetical protein
MIRARRVKMEEKYRQEREREAELEGELKVFSPLFLGSSGLFANFFGMLVLMCVI